MFDEQTRESDSIATALRSYAQHVLVVVFGLLPLFFIPTAVAPFDYSKVLFVVVGVLCALVLYSLSVLRSGVMTVGVSYSLIALWCVVGVAFISSILSGDVRDSLFGDLFSIHSTVFVAILALIPTVLLLLKSEKASVMRMYMLLAVSTLVLVTFHVLRLFFGADFLSFGVFTNNVSTPVGSWNDLALFLGLTVILSLMALEQLRLTKVGRGLFAIVILVSLVMLGVINFFMVWLILGLTSLVMVVYSLGKDRFSRDQLPFVREQQRVHPVSLITMSVVLLASIVFVIGGASVGGAISKLTGVSYVEVRPSFEATADIARNVYHENAFLGIGTNKFTDAWRLYKDTSINLTSFWNTDFNAGNGYITTFFVTTGVLGGIAWVLFLGMFFVTGIRRLLGSTEGDRSWYFIALSSFVSALYIWGLSIVYVPGVVMLLLGALCTGVALSSCALLEGNSRTISIGMNCRSGFILTLAVIVVIIGSVSVLYVASRHYASVYTFNESIRAMQQGTEIDVLERQVSDAYRLSTSDVFARRIAEYQLARMNSLVALQSPTDEDKMLFKNAMENGLSIARRATEIDSLESQNWSVLGNMYGVLSALQIEGAHEEALKALERSRALNPKNPLPYLDSAIVEGRAGNIDAARSYIEEAIALKSNFTEAFYFLSQLEIATGNVEGAIQSTRATINLDPQNAARYYQLGVLNSANNDTEGAISAFERAILLDQNYANARYLLAFAYDSTGRSEDAKKQLEVVLELNPGNEEVASLINIITTEGSLKRLREGVNQPQMVDEARPVTDDNGTVSTSQTSDTTLVTPINTSPNPQSDTEEGAQ